MKRELSSALITWKNKSNRKPLILRGARQVGKTWLLQEFGKSEYAQTAYVNFEKSRHLKTIFESDFDTERIITALEIETGLKIQKNSTLIILDEIQEAPKALTALKYFQENSPEYHIVCAGSLLGVMLHAHVSFPVGKVEFLDVYPLSFREFLWALGENALDELLEKKEWDLIKTFRDKYTYLLKQYYYVGGMPEVVSVYAKTGDFNQVRELQKSILLAYEQDFSKHAPVEIVPRIHNLWSSLPAQLTRENKKFVYGLIRTGARSKEYELAINWLESSGLVHKINLTKKPGIPLVAYQDISAFKLYGVDVGLLGAMCDLDVKTLLEGNKIFEEFKGALTEQYVIQQLILNDDFVVKYWSAENSRAEVDFVIQKSGKIFPLEVKAAENLQAKSLKVYYNKFLPTRAFRTSMSDYREEDWLTNVPLYAVGYFSP